MEKADTRILELIKAYNLPAAQNAENAAQKAMNCVFDCAPRANMENFNYWLLMNYYTYEIVQNMIAKIEKS